MTYCGRNWVADICFFKTSQKYGEQLNAAGCPRAAGQGGMKGNYYNVYVIYSRKCKCISGNMQVPEICRKYYFIIGRSTTMILVMIGTRMQEMSAFTCICMQRSIHRQFILICTI